MQLSPNNNIRPFWMPLNNSHFEYSGNTIIVYEMYLVMWCVRLMYVSPWIYLHRWWSYGLEWAAHFVVFLFLNKQPGKHGFVIVANFPENKYQDSYIDGNV